MDININLWEPHTGQVYIQQNLRKFNAIVCGRRFGKTEFIGLVDYPLLGQAIFEGKFIAVFVPAFKDFEETWNAIVENYRSIIKHKNESDKIIRFLGGGRLDVWSIPDEGSKDKGRGRKYHRVIYEETQKFDEAILNYHWENVAAPTLTDYDGDAIFIGTAAGRGTEWFKICRKGAKNGNCEINKYGEKDLAFDDDVSHDEASNPEWMTFRMPTETNPHIKRSVIDRFRKELDHNTFIQEYEAVFVNYDGEAWVYVLKDKDLQNRVFVPSKPVSLTGQQLYLSFDFNKIPMTAVVGIKTPLPHAETQRTRYKYGLHIIKEFKIGSIERGEASIYDTCQAVREWVFAETGRKIGKWGDNRHACTIPFLITGDASGNRSDGRQKVPKSYYDIIQDELQIAPQMIVIPKANPPHAESYVQTNTIISMNPDFKIYADKCPSLIVDVLRIKSNNSRQIVKGRGEERQADLLDCMRYLLNTFCQDIRM